MKLQFVVIILCLISSFGSCKNYGVDAPASDPFIGAWYSEPGGPMGNMSLFIEQEGELYNCYSIHPNGKYKKIQAIKDGENLKIGTVLTIKYLNENKELYMLEQAKQFKRIKPIKTVLKEIQGDIKEVNGANLSGFLYIPFSDDEANIGGIKPNFSIRKNSNIGAAAELLFDGRVKECLMNPEITYYSDIQNNEDAMALFENHLLPWECQIDCVNAAGRNLALIMSIRENEYKFVRLQFFP